MLRFIRQHTAPARVKLSNMPMFRTRLEDSRRDRAPVLSTNVKTGIFITSLQKRFGRDSSQMSDHYSYFTGCRSRRIDFNLSQELVIDRKHLLKRRHKLQNFVDEASIRIPLPDTVTEVDEMYQMQVKKVSSIPTRMIHRVAVATKLAAWYVGFWSPSGSGYHW